MTNVGSSSRGLRNRRLILVSVVLLLALPYIPYEIVPGGPATTTITLALVLLLAIASAPYFSTPSGVEVALGALAVWVLFRLILYPLTTGGEEHSDTIGALREVSPLLAGLIIFQLAREIDYRHTVLKVLPAVLSLLLVVESYQLLVGGEYLRTLGYLTPRFNYYTEAGDMRPFSTFFSPTMFAPFLAMVGIAMAFSATRSSKQLLWLILTTIGVLLTQTRAAWIGYFIAVLLCLAISGRRVRERLIVIGVTLLPVVAAGLMAVPQVLESIAGRADSIVGADESNTVRIELWEGTLRAIESRPVAGFGHDPFSIVMQKYVGELASYGHAHSNFFETLYLYGVVGLALFATVLISIAIALLRSPRSQYNVAALGVLVVFVVDSFFEATWGNFNVTVTFFLLVSLGLPSSQSEVSLDTGGRLEAPFDPLAQIG